MEEKKIIFAARVVSSIFTPFYLPIVGLVILFLFSYLNMLPNAYKLFALLLVYIFTALLPTFLIRMYRNYQGWTPIQLGIRERRIVPYVISILCYFTCFYIMNMRNMPHLMSSILMAALIVQVLCALINVWWKISTHSAAIGGVTGGLLAFSMIFNFNPVWWLCVLLALAGMVGTSRMILRQHTLSQVVCGYFLGVLAAFISIILV